MRWTRNKHFQGSMTVEAAIIIPVAVMCILPFIYLFRILLFQMIMEKSLDECMREIATEIYILDRISVMPEYDEEDEAADVERDQLEQIQALIDEYTALLEDEGWKKKLEEMGFELLGEWLLEQKMKSRLENENLEAWGVADGWNGISFWKSEFLYLQDGHHYLIKGVISWEWQSMFSFWNPEAVNVTRVYHSFVGEESEQNDDEQQVENEKTEVVYLIGSGTRYHKSNCYLICKNTYATTKNSAEQIGSKPCDRCNPQNDVTVYKTSGGEHYHTGSCSYLYPDTTSMLLEEAIAMGYSGCRICQGENGYFS